MVTAGNNRSDVIIYDRIESADNELMYENLCGSDKDSMLREEKYGDMEMLIMSRYLR